MKISSSSAAGASSSSSDNNNSNNNGRSNNNNNDYINSIVLPPAFVEDPAGFLTSIASRPNPSPDGISLLAGPLSKWFRGAEEAHRESRDTSCNNSSNRSTTTATTSAQNAPVHPAAHVAQLYLCAAATQLRDEQRQPLAPVMGSVAVAAAVAGIAASAANLISREQQENKNRTAKHRDETLEAVASAAVLCSDRSAISSSGILPVLANLVASTTSSSSSNAGGSAVSAISSNKLATSIAASLSNMPSSSSKAFPPLTSAHTAFLQCAVQAEEYEFAETVIRGTWPLPTSTLKKKKGNGNANDDSFPHDSISIILRYYYLRGIVHYGCGRDHHSMAHRCWWTCLCIPVDIVSTIAVQAWKKLTLVQPLLDINDNNNDGERPNRADAIDVDSPATFSVSKNKSKAHPETRLPKCLTKSIRTFIDFSSISARKQEDHQTTTTGAVESSTSREKDLSSVYTRLGPAVEAVDRTSVESLVRAHESVLTADGNMGMAHNCLRRVKELQVRKASKMFSVTSVQILARRWKVTPEEASQQLFDAMKLGVVPCRVEKDGTVVFLSPKDSASNSTTTATTTTSTDLADLTGWMKLLEQLQRMDVNLSISSKYNSAKRKEDKGMIGGDMIGTAGPRGVEEFYGDPTI